MAIFELKAEAPQVRRWTRWLTYLLKVRQVFVLAVFFYLAVNCLSLERSPICCISYLDNVSRHMPTKIYNQYNNIFPSRRSKTPPGPRRIVAGSKLARIVKAPMRCEMIHFPAFASSARVLIILECLAIRPAWHPTDYCHCRRNPQELFCHSMLSADNPLRAHPPTSTITPSMSPSLPHMS
jgi:hypothetical protein